MDDGRRAGHGVGRLLLLGVLLGALLGLLATHRPARVQAEPGPGAETVIKLYAPFGEGTTLNPALQIRGREAVGQCQAGAIRTTRPDAWRCETADPCFVPFSGGDQSTLACVPDPWTTAVVLITPAAPLRDQQDCEVPPTCRRPLDLTRPPWALELANGVRCVLATGAVSPGVAGLGAAYSCATPDGALAGTGQGQPDRSHARWRLFYLPEGAYVVEQTGVLVAWY